MKPITVMIPVYNAGAFIRDTVDSVLSQTFPDFELLLLDDSSTDRSVEIIKSYNDARIRLVSCPHHFINTLNTGLESVNSKYLALLDHDDLMIPNRLKVQYEFMETNPDIDACGGYYYSFGRYSWETKVPLEHNEIIQTLLSYCCMLNTTGFVRMESLRTHGIRYRKGYSFSADYKFWSEIAKAGKITNLPKILAIHRVHNQQTSTRYAEKCRKGANKVKLEMLEYFLSHLKKGNQLAEKIDREFFPVIEELGQMGIFSENVFFQFMYELIVGLRKEGAIDL
jgi:glycosyltransferase involved in cell wall biosynthesis